MKRLIVPIALYVALPAIAFLTVQSILAQREAARPMIERLGIDPDTFNVELFYDTLSPYRAKELGLVSRQPANEYVIVVISTSNCVGNIHPGFLDAVRRIDSLVDAQIQSRVTAVARLVGVSLDRNVTKGFRYLSDLADFDEIVVGGSPWLNTGTEKYWHSYGAAVEIPQVHVLTRTVTYREGAHIANERMVASFFGPSEIVAWVGAGAPLAGPPL